MPAKGWSVVPYHSKLSCICILASSLCLIPLPFVTIASRAAPSTASSTGILSSGFMLGMSSPTKLQNLSTMACSTSPIRSEPINRTARKQNGKSNTDSPKYTPTALHPYFRDNCLNRADSDSDSGLPRSWAADGVCLSEKRRRFRCRSGDNMRHDGREDTRFDAKLVDDRGLRISAF